MEITKELKSKILTYWRDTKKDKEALARTADLFGLREEDVTRIIAVRWKEKEKFWSDERIFRLKAYLSQGMKNAEIANQLGCKPQAVADFKKRNKDMLSAFMNEEDAKLLTDTETASVTESNESSPGKEKEEEPSPAATDESPMEKTEAIKINSSEQDYIIQLEKCQAEMDKLYDDVFSLSGEADDLQLLLGDLLTYFEYRAVHYQKLPQEKDAFFQYHYDILAAKVRTVYAIMKNICYKFDELL